MPTPTSEAEGESVRRTDAVWRDAAEVRRERAVRPAHRLRGLLESAGQKESEAARAVAPAAETNLRVARELAKADGIVPSARTPLHPLVDVWT